MVRSMLLEPNRTGNDRGSADNIYVLEHMQHETRTKVGSQTVTQRHCYTCISASCYTHSHHNNLSIHHKLAWLKHYPDKTKLFEETKLIIDSTELFYSGDKRVFMPHVYKCTSPSPNDQNRRRAEVGN
uniref:Uncharacterized protein n=1 Tax=Rhizophora mucronata TaxID=61149 RepID=A0A2P2JF83_RHIMU